MVCAGIAVGVVLGARVASAQSPDELAQMIEEGGAARTEALAVIRGGAEVAPEVRAALVRVVEAEAAAYWARATAAHRGEPVSGSEGRRPPEVALIEALVATRHPATIPGLVALLGVGGVHLLNGVAWFGEAAVPAVLERVRSPSSLPTTVADGLVALRFVLETSGGDGLSSATLTAMELAARDRLAGTQAPIVLWTAVDLAVVLGEPGLLATVEALATDTAAVRARGVTDPFFAARTMSHAAERLAAPEPLPRPAAVSRHGGRPDGRW